MSEPLIKPASDGYIWAYYQIDDISEPTSLISGNAAFFCSEIIVDGVIAPLERTYQFSTTGFHLVKFKLKSELSYTSSLWEDNSTLYAIYFTNGFGTCLPYAVISNNPKLILIDLGEINYINAHIRNVPNLKHIYGFENVIKTRGAEISGPLLHYPKELNPQYTGPLFAAGSASYPPLIEISIIPEGVTSLPSLCFRQCTNIPYLHFLNITTPPKLGTNNPFYSTSFKLYVGDGSSAEADNAVKEIYLADTEWAKYARRVDTWYNYLHPTT